jgi:glutamine amidotransferase
MNLNKKILILDYGVGNVKSLACTLKKIASKVKISSSESEISKADLLILPGVGSFPNCMNKLKKKGLDKILLKEFKKNKQILGICVGMQIMLKIGEEKKITKGLEVLDGRVKKIDIKGKLPIIGWHKLKTKKNNLSQINNKYFYFIHSYECILEDKSSILSKYEYFSKKIVAIIRKKNFIGTQFHPEKSGNPGLLFLKTIINNQY